jgi:flagellar protein FlbD
MIRLTHLGGEPFILNAELIQYVEARPDTFITLTTGQRLVVAEAMDEVLRRTMVYQQAKHLLPPGHPVVRGAARAGLLDGAPSGSGPGTTFPWSAAKET